MLSGSSMQTIPVSCAIILRDLHILAVKRSESMPLAGFWEFPGGKVEKGESPSESLVREIQEELQVTIQIKKELPHSKHTYTEGKLIQLIPFLAEISAGEVHLVEHEEVRWLGAKELFKLNWAAADVPIVQFLHDNWSELVAF